MTPDALNRHRAHVIKSWVKKKRDGNGRQTREQKRDTYTQQYKETSQRRNMKTKCTRPRRTANSNLHLPPPRSPPSPATRSTTPPPAHPAHPSNRSSLPQRHPLQLIHQPPPVIREHLGVLDPLLRPVLAPPRHVVLRRLEVAQLVADALLYEDGAVVLADDALFVLFVGLLAPRWGDVDNGMGGVI